MPVFLCILSECCSFKIDLSVRAGSNTSILFRGVGDFLEALVVLPDHFLGDYNRFILKK
jgi:hypothetical protein